MLLWSKVCTMQCHANIHTLFFSAAANVEQRTRKLKRKAAGEVACRSFYDHLWLSGRVCTDLCAWIFVSVIMLPWLYFCWSTSESPLLRWIQSSTTLSLCLQQSIINPEMRCSSDMWKMKLKHMTRKERDACQEIMMTQVLKPTL